jgi:bifunctional UDP-N-acetylglucosamine pyrophosphorylase/glucosamine-1-phosphate N-acetyltransferase
MQKKYSVLIPAAGRGSRSGLSFPKCLYRIEGAPILIRIIQSLYQYDPSPVIIINEKDKQIFDEVFAEFSIQPRFVFQNVPTGMGDAVLKADKIIGDDETVLLIWSDIPYLHPDTIRNVINCHEFHQNDFSLVTSPCTDCYTVLKRQDGKVVSLVETRESGNSTDEKGERDIGFFVFRKKPVFDMLKVNTPEAFGKTTGEHGFLYLIKLLATAGYNLEGYPIATPDDLLSFNSPEDLDKIIKSRDATRI